MKPRSPTLEGFRVMFCYPALGVAEIAWRWSLGAAALALFSFALRQYLHTLPVSNADLLFLRSGQPFLVAQAIEHIFRGSSFRFVVAMIVVIGAVAFAWIMTSSIGRAATLRWLAEHFRGLKQDSPDSDISCETLPDGAAQRHPIAEELVADTQKGGRRSGFRLPRLASLIGLNFLRLALTVAATCGSVGAIILAGMVSSGKQPHPGLAFLIMIPLLCLVGLFWSVLNWFLSLASVCTMWGRQDTFGSLSAAVDLCRERIAAVTTVGFWFGFAHLAAFLMATTVVSFPMAFAGTIPFGIVLGGVLLVTLIYFAVADFLYAGRLAAYVAITEFPESRAVRLGVVDGTPPDAQGLNLASPLAQASEERGRSDAPFDPSASEEAP